MKTIGITGGVGSGKSQVLRLLSEHYNCVIYLADQVAQDLYLPGGVCYQGMIDIFGKDIVQPDASLNRALISQRMYSDATLIEKTNNLIHPAVKKFFVEQIEYEKELGIHDYVVIEAALLVEEGYDLILDELWYIYASESVRRKRLKESRNYTDAKIDSIMSAQLSESEFRKHCKYTIDNSGTLERTWEQIQRILGAY